MCVSRHAAFLPHQRAPFIYCIFTGPTDTKYPAPPRTVQEVEADEHYVLVRDAVWNMIDNAESWA
jgi:hypothetical protein